MKGIQSKIMRRVSRRTDRSTLPQIQNSIISFSFDDCPKSAFTNGLPQLETQGWRATIYIACGLCETTNHLGLHVSEADIVDAYNRGHEIADHTYSHLSADAVEINTYMADIESNQLKLQQLGLPESRHFAYPYGHVSPPLKKALRTRFETLRGVVTSTTSTQDANLMWATRIYSNDSIGLALEKIKQAKLAPQWLHLFTHDVRDTPSKFGCTREDFQIIINAVKDSGLQVMTVDEAYRSITETSLPA